MRIWLLREREARLESTATVSTTWRGLLEGHKCKYWDEGRSITFDRLYIAWHGSYRVGLEIVEIEDEESDMEEVQPLFGPVIRKEMGFGKNEVIVEEES